MFYHARRLALPFILVCLSVAVASVAGEKTHRNGFAGKNTFWVKGDANVPFKEQAHRISDDYCRNAPTSEYIKIEANPPPGSIEVEFVDYFYPTPPAKVSERLTAGVWVKSFKPGIQLKARLVLPKERDPNNPESPLTTQIFGDTYRNLRQWQPLSMGNVPEAVRKHLPVLHARLGRAVDTSDAYIDQLILNIYTGQGVSEVWIDDLEVGPVQEGIGPQPGESGAILAKHTQQQTEVAQPKSVEFVEGQIQIDGKPFFMLAIRHTDTPLKTLRDAQFNTVWFPSETPPESIEEAVRHGFWVVPSVPFPTSGWDGTSAKPKRPDPKQLDEDAEGVARFLRRFISSDAVLMWDLGHGRTIEEIGRVARVSEEIRGFDPRRPRGIDIWDGFDSYSSYIDCVGTHRFPLFTSLEMHAYKEWLSQRRALVAPGKMTWTWVQTHLPDWFVTLLAGRPDVAKFDDPIGPHPEQIRILTYLSLAAGNRGLGFWSDRFLANTHHGRDRLLELALLNAEIEMLKPLLFEAQEPSRWIPTSDGSVQAAVIRGPKELLVLPIWLGSGTQYCPAQGALPALTIRVPLVPDGAIPWLVTPAGITELKNVRRVAGGTEVTIPEFDMTAAVVFTSDLKLDGKIVRWQDHTRYRMGELAARWALQQAVEQYNKTLATHDRILAAGGPALSEAEDLFIRSKRYIDLTKEFMDNRQWDAAYRESRRALRPLRVLMREHWRRATESLDIPTASPYAVSFYSLPYHWILAQQVQASRPLNNTLPYGQFELSRPAPEEGAAVNSLPGWKVRKSTLDKVVATAAIVNSDKLEDPISRRQPPPRPARTGPDRVAMRPDEAYVPAPPELGQHCLKLQILADEEKDRQGNPIPPSQVLERSFLAVDSPVIDLTPGLLVRVSFWVKVAGEVTGSADAVVVYDSAGGEPLSVRLASTGDRWKKYHLYRRVPANGKMSVSFSTTGYGTVYFDDVRIEPLVQGVASEAPLARGQRR